MTFRLGAQANPYEVCRVGADDGFATVGWIMIRPVRGQHDPHLVVDGGRRTVPGKLPLTANCGGSNDGLHVRVGRPQVAYRESVVRGVAGLRYRHVKQDGGQGQFALTYSFSVTPPAGTKPVITTVTWSGPATIRCDDLVGGSKGCVFPDFPPTLELPVARFGAGAMTVLFAQANLPDAWGYSKPLHREGSDAVANTNRSKICDSTWVPDPTVPNDSCDEYAFAKTKESGAQLGLRGSDCAEVRIAKDSAGQWIADLIKFTGQERCVRAHVPNPENTAVGGELGRFTTANRLLDKDAYYVNVS